MVQTSAGAPIPPAKKDDSEDVAWALSTAEAMYARGDRGEALKWLRRAAEAASEAQADDRALELAKAAADLASAIGPVSNPPPAPSRPPPAPPAAAAAPPAAAPPAAAPAAAPAASTPSPRPPPPPAARPAQPRAAGAPAKPLPPARPQRVAMRAAVPFESTGVRPTEARRTRRSRPEISFARQTEEVTESMPVDAIPAPHAPEPRRRRASKPSFDDATPPVAPVIPPPEPTPMPATPRPEALAEQALAPRTDEMDAWPTQSREGDDLSDPADEKTRIGVPAYEASAKLITEGTLAPIESPALRPSQALRVVVWRAADGVHVAPAGTRVGAITVEALLVALDPAADLASWLSSK